MFKTLIDSVLKDRTGYVSRKLSASWILTGLVTVLLLFSHFWNYYTGSTVSPLISGDHFVTLMGLMWSTYFATNVIGEFIDSKSSPPPLDIEEEEFDDRE